MPTVWIKEDAKYTWTQRFVMGFLKRGPMPRHAAIIMDGNRRFASKNSIEKIQGHTRGFEKLTEVSFLSRYLLIIVFFIITTFADSRMVPGSWHNGSYGLCLQY